MRYFLAGWGDHLWTDDELNAPCEQLAASGELRVVEQGRWFALAH
ncbi:hypothetical protein [Lentzea sp. NPDC003310]